MLIKSLVNKSYDPQRFKSVFIFRGYGKNDQPKFEEIKTEILKLKIEEELGLLSQNSYVNKKGFFYTVINRKNETFFLNQDEINFNDILPYQKIIFSNRTPRYIDCIEEEIFDLDLL